MTTEAREELRERSSTGVWEGEKEGVEVVVDGAEAELGGRVTSPMAAFVSALIQRSISESESARKKYVRAPE